MTDDWGETFCLVPGAGSVLQSMVEAMVWWQARHEDSGRGESDAAEGDTGSPADSVSTEDAEFQDCLGLAASCQG